MLEHLKPVLATGLPMGLAFVIVHYRLAPLAPVENWRSVASVTAPIVAVVGGGVAYLFPTRSGVGRTNLWHTGVLVCAVIVSVLLVWLYDDSSSRPPEVDWYTYYYVKTLLLFLAA